MKWTTILLLFVIANSLHAQQQIKKISETDFVIGKSVEIQSEALNETRLLNIYLPLSYEAELDKTYPVIYLLDGAKDEDFIHISGIVQFGSFSWISMLPESIVVGIANTDRKRDFTYPSKNKLDQKEFPTSGKSKRFINFIENELQPFVNSEYRTTKEKTIIGQSLGGLLATEILFTSPNLFDNYIIVSPSLWWDDEKLLDRATKEYVSNKFIYIAGGKEGEVMERTAKELFNKLNQKQRSNTNLSYDFMPTKTHGDALHIAVYNAFTKIYSKGTE